jgi:ABC-type multidrug transport system fused ATPase/permease subunit
LLNGTIMENLSYGDTNASPGKVVEAAIASGINDFVKSLPQGYESIIGENGVNLSEGQKQRLSLARALIKEPDIFILDEPTANLDNLTEKSILESLAGLFENKTVFIVSHSLPVVEKCDQVILLDRDGRATQGTHEQLNQTNELYRELFRQSQSDEFQFQPGYISASSSTLRVCAPE